MARGSGNYSANSLFRSLEIGAVVPDWTVRESDLTNHLQAFEWMAARGPVMDNGRTYYMSLKQEYVTVFINNMKSPLVSAARRAGWLPLFCAKNFLPSFKPGYGMNGGWQVTSVNLTPKSYLCLLGFFKKNADGEIKIIMLRDSTNRLMVLDRVIN